MIRSKRYCFCMAVCMVLLSCSEIKELVLPKGIDKNFRSGEIKYPLFKSGRAEVLEYRVISDSVKEYLRYDTTITFGVILPRSSAVMKVLESNMIFGTDSLQCIIQYKATSFQTESKSHSILSDIIIPGDKNDPNYDRDRNRTDIVPYKRIVTGSIQLPQLEGEVPFWFEHQKAGKDFDSANIKGYLKQGSDSFFIQPLYKESYMRGKEVKPMQVLQGYSLMKGDSLVAFLQHAPLVKTVYTPALKDVLYLNSKASPAEQLLLAAYFSLVSRVVLTTDSNPLY